MWVAPSPRTEDTSMSLSIAEQRLADAATETFANSTGSITNALLEGAQSYSSKFFEFARANADELFEITRGQPGGTDSALRSQAKDHSSLRMIAGNQKSIGIAALLCEGNGP